MTPRLPLPRHSSRRGPQDLDAGLQPLLRRQECNDVRQGRLLCARDSSYSAQTLYSRPDADGVQHIFVCRVTVGVFCKGRRDAPAPDPRPGHAHLLYDTTVDDPGVLRMGDPTIYVTYHDAQAYPEYLVKFKQP